MLKKFVCRCLSVFDHFVGLGLKGLKGKGTEATPHKNKVEYLAQNHKTLKQTFFKSVRWYEIIHGCIKCEVVKEKNMSKYQIISICQRLINIINCALEGASLTTKQDTVKKMRICFNIKATRTKWTQKILKTMFEFMLSPILWYWNQILTKNIFQWILTLFNLDKFHSKLLQCVYFYNLTKSVHLNHSYLLVLYKFNSVNDNVFDAMSNFEKNLGQVG